MNRLNVALERVPRSAVSVAVVVTLLIVGAVVGLAAGSGRTTEFEARALLAADAQDPSPSAGLQASSGKTQASANLATATAAAVDRDDVVAEVRGTSPAAPGRPDVRVRGFVLPGTTVAAIVATSSDRATALSESRAFALTIRRLQIASDRKRFARAANALAAGARSTPDGNVPDAIATQVAQLRSSARTAIPLSLVRVGEVDVKRPSPSNGVLALVGAAVGLLIGLALLAGAFWWRRRGHRIVDLPALRKDPAPVLGALPPLRTFEAPGDRFSLTTSERELFRIVRRGVRDIAGEEPRVVLVTSAHAAAGKSSTAVGLASAAAEAGQRVLLVECDLRIPSQASRLGLKKAPGLAEYLAASAEPRSTLQVTRCPYPEGSRRGSASPSAEFFAVTAGRSSGPVQLDGAALDRMLEHVRSGYDLVLLDAPPLLGAVDAGDLVGRADVVVVCARLGQITSSGLRSAVSVAERGGGRHVGVVATGVRPTQDPARETEVYGATGD